MVTLGLLIPLMTHFNQTVPSLALDLHCSSSSWSCCPSCICWAFLKASVSSFIFAQTETKTLTL